MKVFFFYSKREKKNFFLSAKSSFVWENSTTFIFFFLRRRRKWHGTPHLLKEEKGTAVRHSSHRRVKGRLTNRTNGLVNCRRDDRNSLFVSFINVSMKTTEKWRIPVGDKFRCIVYFTDIKVCLGIRYNEF